MRAMTAIHTAITRYRLEISTRKIDRNETFEYVDNLEYLVILTIQNNETRFENHLHNLSKEFSYYLFAQNRFLDFSSNENETPEQTNDQNQDS